MQHNLPGISRDASAPERGQGASRNADRDEGAADIERQILKFLRQMHAGDDDATLRNLAIERRWLGDDGAPTEEGRRLARGFADLDEARALGAF